MPRRTSPTGRPADVEGTELRPVRVELTPTIHKELRLEAARQDRSMASLVRVLIEKYLSSRRA